MSRRVPTWLATAILIPGLVLAQSKPFLFFGDAHVLVDPNSPAGRDYLQHLAASGPTPLASAPVIKVDSTLGNVKVTADLGPHGCGDRSETKLVLCLNGQGRLSYGDSLAALAFASRPTTAYVPDDTVRQYLAALLARLPNPLTANSVQILTSTCAAACAHQITLERRT